MNLIKDFFKGILIGVANIIPGVSGGTMAVSMGVYDQLISAITGIVKNFKRSMRILLPILLGAVAGIGGLSFVIKFMLENYPLQTSTLFIGLILGGLPVLFSHVKGAKVGVPHAVLFIIFFAIVIAMAVFNGSADSATDIAVNFGTVIQLFLVGVVASATMIIPGVSGSLVMMILGFYNIIISNISTMLTAVANLDMPGILHGVGIFAPLGLGIIAGIVIVAKVIEWLFAKQPILTYSAIFGLVIASPIAIICKIGIHSISIGGVIVSIITFAIGFAVAYFLGKE